MPKEISKIKELTREIKETYKNSPLNKPVSTKPQDY